MNNHRVFLASNVNDSQVLNNENTRSSFRVPLAQPLQVDGKYEVGLEEIFIPNYFSNIHAPFNEIEVYSLGRLGERGDDTKTEYVLEPNGQIRARDLPPLEQPHIIPWDMDNSPFIEQKLLTFAPGKYTPEKFCSAFNKKLSKYEKFQIDCVMKYDSTSKKITISLGPGVHMCVRHERLQSMLGFTEEMGGVLEVSPLSTQKSKKKLPLPAEFDCNIDKVLVYSNIVEYSIVSNYFALLIRLVNIADNRKSVIHRQYDKPQYHSVNTTQINTITIQLRDTLGNLLNVERGNVWLVLHFRPEREKSR